MNKDACRIYGTLLIHKCNGDFHITAQGHGYQKLGQPHLDHDSNSSLLHPLLFLHRFSLTIYLFRN